MVAYIDSSVILRHILLGETAIKHAFACDRAVSSELTEIECRRVLHRYRMDGDVDDEGFLQSVERLAAVLGGISVVGLSGPVKNRAMASFPVSMRTLDALHIASVETYARWFPQDSVAVFTHDRAMNRCATVLGYATPLSA
jgi:hypothetical protein